MISVIIPAYNAEKYIDKCFISLFQQTYKNYEIVFINDGSIDNTEIKANLYAEQHNNVQVITQINQGVSAARNTGIEYARGEYIFFLDVDDYLHEEVLEELMNEVEKYDADLICGEITDRYSCEVARKAFISNESFSCNSEAEIGEKLFYIRMGSAVGKLFRKSIIEKNNIRFKNEVNLAEDFIFVHEYVLKCNSLSKNINAKYIVENINSESLSKRYVEDIERIMIMQNEVLCRTFSRFPEYEVEYYKYSVDIDVKACFFIFKNSFLKGSRLTVSEKMENIKSSEYIQKILKNLPIKDIKKKPKMKNDFIQYKILCTKNIYFIFLAYYFLEKIKMFVYRIRNLR